jgi:hypothetical protein
VVDCISRIEAAFGVVVPRPALFCAEACIVNNTVTATTSVFAGGKNNLMVCLVGYKQI